MSLMNNDKNSEFDAAVTQCLDKLQNESPVTDEYAKCVAQLEKLNKMRDGEKPDRISLDTLALLAGNLLGIGVIVWHEREHVLTTKALSFLPKLR